MLHWKQVFNTSGLNPTPRHGHRAVAIKELIVYFGGGNCGIFSELFVYNTVRNHWFNPTVRGDIPEGRAAFGFVLDKTRILMFGGMLEYGETTDQLYELQPSHWEWRNLKPRPPPDLKPPPLPRIGHSFTWIDEKVYLFGGLTLDVDNTDRASTYPRFLNDLYILDLSKNTWTIPFTHGNPPSARESHSAVAHTDINGDQKLIIYGGMCGQRLGDVWVLCISSMSWVEIITRGISPLPRSLHTATLIGDKMYVFGGWVPLCQYRENEWKVTDQLLSLNLNSMVWEDLTNDMPLDKPRARAGHCAVEINGLIYMWSGRDGFKKYWNKQVCCDDMWVLEVSSPLESPRPQLLKGAVDSLEISWSPSMFGQYYLVQIQKVCFNSKNTNPSLYFVNENVNKLNPSSSIAPSTQDQQKNSTVNEHPEAGSTHFKSAPTESGQLCDSSEASSSLGVPEPANIAGKTSISVSPNNSTVIAELTQKAAVVLHKSPTSKGQPFLLVKAPKGGYTFQRFSMLPVIRQANFITSNTACKLEIGSKAVLTGQSTPVKLHEIRLQKVNKVFLTKNVQFESAKINKDDKNKSMIINSNVIEKTNSIIPEKKEVSNENTLSSVDSMVDLRVRRPLQTLGSTKGREFQKSHVLMASGPGILGEPPKNLSGHLPRIDQIKKIAPESQKFQSAALHVKIVKSYDGGAFISWTPPKSPDSIDHCVTLIVKTSFEPSGRKVIYKGIRPECFVTKELLDQADLDYTDKVPAIKFFIAGKSSLGTPSPPPYPSLVRWFQHNPPK